MRILILLISALVTLSSGADECQTNVQTACSQSGSLNCNALFGGIVHTEQALREYASNNFEASYDYLILASRFETYQKNRPGFHKILKGLSDKAWNHGISLIKHIVKRGGNMVIDFPNAKKSSIMDRKYLEVGELEALSIALDTEKKLTSTASKIHRAVSHAHHLKPEEEHYVTGEMKYDPEIAQFLEEEFLEDQAEVIRKLSGYVNDISKLMSVKDSSLSIYLFDEYLVKQ